MRSIAQIACLLALAACRSMDADIVGTATPDGPRNPLAAAQFERLKTLDGEYVAIEGDGDEASATPLVFGLTAGGATLTERCFVGSPHEMLTTFYLDAGELVLNHYCVAGNQPHMVAAPGESDRSIVFDCVGGGNLVDCTEPHMHRGEYTFGDDGTIESMWTFYEDGRPQAPKRFRIVRR